MLRIENLTHIYSGGLRALDNVSLTIGPGMFGLLGPNGAGKSTLMRHIATLQTPASGTIAFDGIDAVREPERLRRVLGYLPQDFGVYPRVTAYRLLDHLAVLKGIARRGERRDTVESLLQRTNLWAARNRAVSDFSGGMRQRFGIAQALIGEPALLIVDEPTAGLDPEERNRFLNLLSDVSERVVVILSTHIVQDVAALCMRMAIIAGGCIVAEGEPSELTARLRGRIWSKTVPKAELARYRQDRAVVLTRLIGGRILIHVCSDADPRDGFTPVDPDLEDFYFVSLSGSHAA
jgi:ABC-2 type transport system ATP-binding protein